LRPIETAIWQPRIEVRHHEHDQPPAIIRAGGCHRVHLSVGDLAGWQEQIRLIAVGNRRQNRIERGLFAIEG
jgi:hypothetical protein